MKFTITNTLTLWTPCAEKSAYGSWSWNAV